MKVESPQQTPEQTLALAEEWFTRQCDVLAKCHGTDWPKHRQWIEDYLREQLRQRLVALGWRLTR